MNKNQIIDNAISKFREECSKISDEKSFMEKIPIHEELLIKIILDTLLENS